MTENAEYEHRLSRTLGSEPCITVSTPHDWRLIEETRRRRQHEEGVTNYRRRWYCTRCRLVEDWTSE